MWCPDLCLLRDGWFCFFGQGLETGTAELICVSVIA